MLELSLQLTSDDLKTRSAAKKNLLAIGRSAIYPLLAISVRAMPQSEAVEGLLPEFGIDDVIAEAVEVVIIDASRSPCRMLARVGPLILPSLKRLIENDDSRDQQRQRLAVCVFEEMGADGIPTLIELGQSQNARARAVALRQLSVAADARAIPLFLSGLSDPDPNVRRLSANGIRKHPDARAIPGLLAMVRGGGQEEREAGISALGAQYSRDLRPVIAFSAWTDAARLVRRDASYVLSSSEDRVAQRLGKRYYAHRYYPSMGYFEWGPRVSVAVVFLCLTVALGTRLHRSVGLLGTALLGAYWGWWATDQWIYTEAFLLGVFVPGALAVLWRWGARWPVVPISASWVLGQLLVPALFSLPIVFYGDAAVIFVNHVGPILAIPAIGLAYRFREEGSEGLRKSRRVVRQAALVFYASYGVAFAALWGYLGF